MLLIGISGKRGSGKDLLASFLRKKYGFINLPFAEELKRKVREDFSLTKEHTDGELKEQPTKLIKSMIHAMNGMVFRKEFWTPREIMIEYGKFFRQFDQDFWTNKTFEQIYKIKTFYTGDKANLRFSISDIRFLNEAEYVKSRGGILVRLERKPELNIYKEVSLDQSEVELDNYEGFDFKLSQEENITSEDLRRFSDMIMEKVVVK